MGFKTLFRLSVFDLLLAMLLTVRAGILIKYPLNDGYYKEWTGLALAAIVTIAVLLNMAWYCVIRTPSELAICGGSATEKVPKSAGEMLAAAIVLGIYSIPGMPAGLILAESLVHLTERSAAIIPFFGVVYAATMLFAATLRHDTYKDAQQNVNGDGI